MRPMAALYSKLKVPNNRNTRECRSTQYDARTCLEYNLVHKGEITEF